MGDAVHGGEQCGVLTSSSASFCWLPCSWAMCSKMRSLRQYCGEDDDEEVDEDEGDAATSEEDAAEDGEALDGGVESLSAARSDEE